MSKEFFIVIDYIENTPKGSISDIQGVFSSEDAAVAACITENHCIMGPFRLDEMLPDKITAVEVVYYPLLETKEEGQARAGEYIASIKEARSYD
jgi:hypothetical protein